MVPPARSAPVKQTERIRSARAAADEYAKQRLRELRKLPDPWHMLLAVSRTDDGDSIL